MHNQDREMLSRDWYRDILARIASDSELICRYNILPDDELFPLKQYGLQSRLSSKTYGYSLLALPAGDGKYQVFDVTIQRSCLDARIEMVLHFPCQ